MSGTICRAPLAELDVVSIVSQILDTDSTEQ